MDNYNVFVLEDTSQKESVLCTLEYLCYLNMSPRGNHNCKQQPSLVALDA